MLITGHCFLKRKHFRAKRESLKQFSLRQHSVKNHNQISQMESWGMRWTCHDCHSSIGCLQLLNAKDFSCYRFWWIRLVDTSPRPISTQLGRFLDTAATIATWWFFKVGQFLGGSDWKWSDWIAAVPDSGLPTRPPPWDGRPQRHLWSNNTTRCTQPHKKSVKENISKMRWHLLIHTWGFSLSTF